MKLIWRYLKKYAWVVALAVGIKFCGTLAELSLPYVLEHIIDDIVPGHDLGMVILWGSIMFIGAVLARVLNVSANRKAIRNAHLVSYDVRQALFEKVMRLTGAQVDEIGLPSLISRMTSDSYNVQSLFRSLQTLCIRAPILLVGGILFTLTLDVHLALILVAMLPLLVVIIVVVSRQGIPLYAKVQKKLDAVVRIMRESITGIRVVKALGREEQENRRFGTANADMAASDITAGTVMAIPQPALQLCLNLGLILVVVLGARRVDAGLMKPGIILAFLTYFNMIANGVMGVSRIFIAISQSSASADRIDAVLQMDTSGNILPAAEAPAPSGDGHIRFEHVDFSYGSSTVSGKHAALGPGAFDGNGREKTLSDIDFTLQRGESLGIIGPTGCGKTSVINLLMRFYEPDAGHIFVDGQDIRTYSPDALRQKFGTVFQNDMVFHESLRDNIRFERDVEGQAIRTAVESAMAAGFIDELEDGLDYEAAIRGANLSGGQKQRILVARALAADPEILILDDSSSALDYRTDAAMRRAILQHYGNATLIMISQRVSSVMGLDHVMVLDNGRIIGYGTHEELMDTCPAYRETYLQQTGLDA